MTTLTDLTIADALTGLAKKDFTATEVTSAHIDAMAREKQLNCFITETPELALARAKASDENYASGKAGKLEGIPLAIKDLFCTEGVRTTAASKILENFVPAYESTVTRKLKEAGSISLGKTNLDEFAMGSSNTTSAYGKRREPLAAQGRSSRAGAGRLVRRVGGGGCRAHGDGRDGHGYRRIDPPARRVLRHCRRQADLWQMLTLGHGGVCLFTRSGGGFCAHGT